MYVRYFQGLDSRTVYEFKFIVDGSYQLSSRYDIEESTDESKGMVNVMHAGNLAEGTKARGGSLSSQKSFTTVMSSEDERVEWVERKSGMFSVFDGV